MPTAASVLLFGNDSHLLRSRRWLVESLGFKVFATDNILTLHQIFTEHPVDVMVLCHSLSPEESERAKAMAREYSPGTRVLILAVSEAHIGPENKCAVSVAEGPKALLEAVEQLAESRIPPQPIREESSSNGQPAQAQRRG